MKKANFSTASNALKALLVVLMAFAFSAQAQAQCTLVCNNLIQVSLDDDCSVALNPDQVLEGDADVQCPGGNLVVEMKINNAWIPAVLTNAQLNQTLEVRVRDLNSGQTCWGNVSVEDKLAPSLACLDATVSCAAIAANAATFPANLGGVVPVVTENCGTATTSFSDVFTDLPCSDAFSASLVRTWTATDNSGNYATCSQTIFFERATLADVVCPTDVTLDCSAGFQADANGNPHPNQTGAPTIDGSSIYPSAGACEINTIYTDQIIPVCDGTQKILRTWTIAAWCEPTLAGVNPKLCVQLIKISDETGPVIACPDDMTVSTNPFDCQRDLDLPDVIIEDACSQISSIKAQYSVNGVTTTVNGSLQNFPGNNLWTPDTLGTVGIANNLPLGTTDVTYTVTDDCGNSSVCNFKVKVEDQIPPAAICDEHTVVSLGFNGQVRVPASVFDDGSYDNCSDVYFKVRRMNNNSCDPANRFDDYVQFCCEDIGDTITVVFRAYDLEPVAGAVGLTYRQDNSNDCMVTVVVQDKLRPVCQAPANVTVDCEAFDASLWAYGFAQGTDNCCLDTVTVNNSFAQFDTVCNVGRITRTFRVIDCAGLSSSCTQSVTVEYNQDYYLEFPSDVTVYECNGSDTYGEPVIYDEDCELMGVSYTDEIITVVPDACYKIERTWKVTNWCTYDPNLDCEYVNNPNDSDAGPRLSPFAPQSGHPHEATNADYFAQYVNQLDADGNVTANCWTYKQIIKIIDGEAPVATTTQPSCDLTPNASNYYNDAAWFDATHGLHDLCEGPADLGITATDSCSGDNISIRYLLFLDTDGDGSMETVINSQTVNNGTQGFINVGNSNNPSFTGGTPVRFDAGAPGRDIYRFGLKSSSSNGVVTASVAWKEHRFRFDAASGVTPELPYGTHKIKWFVEDGCGNEKVEEFTFSISDCKKPTVVCKNGVSVNLMNSNPAMVTLWASDFFEYAEDNCTPADQLKIAVCLDNPNALPEDACSGSFPLNPDGTPDTRVNFNCAHLGTVQVQIWAQDKAGNEDFCIGTVSVQDNMGVCGSTTSATVAGALETATDGVSDANVNLTSPAHSAAAMSDNAGHYDFFNVPLASNIEVKPSKNDDHLNGVNAYDLLLIQKHLLGAVPLNSPYKMIAADVNNSGSITPSDIIELRKLILGMYPNGLPANESWRFVDQSYVFPNPANPFANNIPEMIAIDNIQQNMTSGMFEAIKIGDLNASALANANSVANDRTNGTVSIEVADQAVVAGDIVTVEFNSADAAAYQFTMNTNGLEVVEMLPGANMTEANFAVFAAKEAVTAAVEANAGNFAITFRATAAGNLSEMISLGNSITNTVAFKADGTRQDVELRFNGDNGSITAGAAFELMQNSPNPVSELTNINFVLPEAGEATLTVTNVEGRVIRMVNGTYAKGVNTIVLDRAQLEAGVLFYQLDSNNNSAVKKMVVID